MGFGISHARRHCRSCLDTDMHMLLPAASLPGSESREQWSFREGKCSFLLLFFMPTAEGTASTTCLCPGPSFYSLVCLLWYESSTSDCHQPHNQQHPVLSKWCVNHGLATSVWLSMRMTWFGKPEGDPKFSSKLPNPGREENRKPTSSGTM